MCLKSKVYLTKDELAGLVSESSSQVAQEWAPEGGATQARGRRTRPTWGPAMQPDGVGRGRFDCDLGSGSPERLPQPQHNLGVGQSKAARWPGHNVAPAEDPRGDADRRRQPAGPSSLPDDDDVAVERAAAYFRTSRGEVSRRYAPFSPARMRNLFKESFACAGRKYAHPGYLFSDRSVFLKESQHYAWRWIFQRDFNGVSLNLRLRAFFTLLLPPATFLSKSRCRFYFSFSSFDLSRNSLSGVGTLLHRVRLVQLVCVCYLPPMKQIQLPNNSTLVYNSTHYWRSTFFFSFGYFG